MADGGFLIPHPDSMREFQDEQARVNALFDDRDRLDKLERLSASLHCNYESGPECWTVTLHCTSLGGDYTYHGPTVRQAIDATPDSMPPERTGSGPA